MTADEQPTPEQLVEMLRAPQTTAAGVNQTVEEVIRLAEAGGADHMAAVSKYMVDQGVSATYRYGPLYDASTGLPAFHETNVLILCRVNVEGRVFTAREAVDPLMLQQRIDLDGDHLERFIKYWLHHNFGKMADGEGYDFLRSRVQVVYPDDEHDLERCKTSAEGDPDRLLTAVCWHGEIIRPPRIIDYYGEGSPMTHSAVTDQRLGRCPCRCHTRPGAEPRVRQAPGTGVFDEDRFDG